MITLNPNPAANREIERIRGQALWDEYCILHENPTSHETRERLEFLETALTEIRSRIKLNTTGEQPMNELKQHIITALDLAQTHLDEGNIEGALICQQGALRQVAALLGGETETTVLEGATVDCEEA